MKRKIFCLTIIFTLFVTCFAFAQEANDFTKEVKQANKEIYIAIIIDDFGNGTKDVEDMLSLSVPFTGAVIPGQLHSVEHMKRLKELEKGVIIHLPMEAKGHKKSWDTPFSLYTGLSNEEVIKRTTMAIEELREANGLNNHMGSIATANKELMKSVVSTVNEHGLIMIDSVTTNKSKVKEVSEEMGLNFFARDVFLDDSSKSTTHFVEKRMKEALKVAKQKGYAIAIGHVGPSGGINTVNGIKNTVPELEAQGVKFVTIEELHDIIHGGSLKKLE